MAQRRKKEVGGQPSTTADITSFLGPQSSEGEVKQPYLSEDIEASVLDFLRSRGSLTRSELYEWSKKRGIKPVELYRCLSSLLNRGVLSRRFDTEKEEYVFYLVRH